MGERVFMLARENNEWKHERRMFNEVGRCLPLSSACWWVG